MKNLRKNKKGIGALIVVILVVAIVAVIVGVIIAINNNIISLGVTVDQKWSEVRNQYQRQADLIPNLVETAKGYMTFEAGVLTNVTNARTAWLNSLAQSELKQDTAGVNLNIATGQFLATMESYPELKSVTVVQTLMDELAGTQNRITVARGNYIEAIGDYNRAVQTFPGNMFGHAPKEYYQGSEGNENPPVVNFP